MSLQPYADVGPAALNKLQSILYKGQVPNPATVRPYQPMLPRFAPGGGTSAMLPGSITSAINTGPGGEAVNVPGQVASQRGKNSLIGTALGTAAPFGLGLATSAMLGAPVGMGLGLGLGALGGPIGLGLGALGGFIGSQFGKHNPEKAAASRGIDEVSRLIWGTNTPNLKPEQLTQGLVYDMLHGKIPIAQGKQQANQWLNEWEQGMRDQGISDDIIESSVRTQMSYLSPLRDIFSRLESKQAA
jgi:hypothetical protein